MKTFREKLRRFYQCFFFDCWFYVHSSMNSPRNMSVSDTHSLAFSSVRKCQNQHRLLQGKNQKENRVIFALLLC